MARETVLVVDDDRLQRWAFCKQLTDWDYTAIEAADGRSGLEAFAANVPDLVLLDLQLPDMDGLDVLRQIKASDPQAVVIMVTAHGGVDAAVDAFRLGLFDYLPKEQDRKLTVLRDIRDLMTDNHISLGAGWRCSASSSTSSTSWSSPSRSASGWTTR